MQPLTLFLVDGTPQRGYWHLHCFELAREAIKKAAKPGGLKSGEIPNGG